MCDGAEVPGAHLLDDAFLDGGLGSVAGVHLPHQVTEPGMGYRLRLLEGAATP
jgi:hypothetical protein